MKLSGYLIEKYNKMGNAYTCRRLLEEAQKQNIDLKLIGVYDSSVAQDGCYNNGTLLSARDFVINRYKFGKIKNNLNKLGKKSYNAIEPLNIYINKLEQLKNIESHYFQKPKYLAGMSDLPFEMLADILKLPFVAKGLESSMGQEVFLIKSKGEYNALSQSFLPNKEWLFEEFIRSSEGRDMRLYCVRGEVIAGMERISNNDFRANVALGSSVHKIEITPEFQAIAQDIYRQTGLDFIGLDLLFGKNEPYFCEINVTAGMEGIEKASGINVAGTVIKTIKGDFNAD